MWLCTLPSENRPMKCSTCAVRARLGAGDDLLPGLALPDRAGGDGVGDQRRALRVDLAGADGVVADLGVAHVLVGGHAHRGAVGAQGDVGVLREQAVEGGLARGVDGAAGLRQLHRFQTLGRFEVIVARRQRQTIGRAQGRSTHNLDRQGELARHSLDNHQLLIVLLPEQGDTRLHAGKQLQHHRAHTAKETRAEMALQDVRQFGRRLHGKPLRFGVELFFAGRKQHITTGSIQRLAVGLPGTRVGIKVFVRQELQTVDKNTHHHHIA
jgi:hypothetical protein